MLTHPRVQRLRAGTKLWHVYKKPYAANAFNPASENRFAARRANPPRAMYYAGATPEVAMWETALRDVIADSDGCTVVYPQQLAGRMLARVQTTTAVQLIDLAMPRLRLHVGTNAELAAWQELQRTTDYDQTHRAAEAVLAQTTSIGALKWVSKQAGSGAAYVFFAPPQGQAAFAVLRKYPLDEPKGWPWVDRALRQAGIQRIDPAALRTLP